MSGASCTWLLAMGCGVVLLLAACHPSPDRNPAMADHRVFSITAEVVAVQQFDLSKRKGHPNLYTELELKVLSATNVVDPQATLEATACRLRRPSKAGDTQLRPGSVIQCKIGVDRLEKPTQFYWVGE